MEASEKFFTVNSSLFYNSELKYFKIKNRVLPGETVILFRNGLSISIKKDSYNDFNFFSLKNSVFTNYIINIDIGKKDIILVEDELNLLEVSNNTFECIGDNQEVFSLKMTLTPYNSIEYEILQDCDENTAKLILEVNK